jgi:ketopantoate reductase
MAIPPRVLVVGAGAVGQVYARHLQLGGAEVTLFVRAAYRADAARGFTLYPLNARAPTAPVAFAAAGVVTTAAEVAARTFDQVYLTVSSPALAGSWLGELVAAAGDATIVALQPGPGDRATLLAAGIAEDRLVSGLLTLISYAAPLPGETRFPRPGMAYWFPPLGKSPVSGPRERAAAVVAALTAGKLPARLHRAAPGAAAFPTAIMSAYLAALEIAGWSLRALVASGAMTRGGAAAREAMAALAAQLGHGPPLSARLIARPRVLRLGLWSAGALVPLPLEVYLREHFTKVHDQTVEFMAALVAKGQRSGVDVATLASLLGAIAPARAAAAAAGP